MSTQETTTVIVAPRRSIATGDVEKDTEGRIVRVVSTNHSEGAALELPAWEAERLIAAGFAHRPGEAPLATPRVAPQAAADMRIGLQHRVDHGPAAA